MSVFDTLEELQNAVRNVLPDDKGESIVKLIEEITIDLIEEQHNLKRDIELLSKKVGAHDIYFNRIKKGIEEIKYS